jgi:hypothetical protein
MSATIAPKLYVTVQYRGDAGNTDGLLGFASPYTKDSAFAKRKSTQDSWAYGSGVTASIDDEDNITVTGSGHRGGYGRGEEWDASMLFVTGCYPRIIDNDPIEGFEIAKSVRRYGWNGGGNVKWRITDPRGFDLEISSENFASVLACTTMTNGVIQGKCAWGREGKDNILLPVESEPYKTATVHTAKFYKKISLKDIKPGDTVEVLSTKVAAEHFVCEYLGKYFFLKTEYTSAGEASNSYNRHVDGYEFTKQTESYLFKSKKDGSYFSLATPKVVDIIEQAATASDKLEIAKQVSSELSCIVGIDNESGCILISPTKIKDIVTTLVPITETILAADWPKVDSYYMDSIICESNGDYFLPTRNSRDYQDKSPQLNVITTDLANNKIKLEFTRTKNTNRSYYQNYDYTYTALVCTDSPDAMNKLRITVTANGVTGRVFRI